MKILHINRNYVDTQLHQLMVEELDKIGYSNHVFVPRYHNEGACVTPDANVCVCQCFKKWHRFLYWYKQKRILHAAEASFNVNEYDLIHAYTLFTDGNCARELSKKYNVPYVVAVRNTDVNDFFRLMPHLRNRGIKIMLDATAVFFLSESYREQVFDKYVPKKYKDELFAKTHIIPNGINDFWFENKYEYLKTPSENELNLIYAGRIDKNKNIPTTQKALAILKNKGYSVHLTLVGKIDDIREYEKIIEDGNTTYFPPVSKEKLIDYYRKAHIFVMPSYTESFGLVYVEAMSQALPVIYSKGQGFDGQFAEGVAGYGVISSSPESVADGICKILDNYEKISSAAPDNISRFKWSEIVKTYDKVYTQINGRG